MSQRKHNLILGLAVFFLLQITAFAQNKFEAVLRNTEDYTTQTPSSSTQIYVYFSGGLSAGTDLVGDTMLEEKLKDCITGANLANPFTVTSGSYCFKGNEKLYDVKVVSDGNKVRRMISEDNISTAGIYRLTDFGGLGDSSSDNTYIIKSAMAYIGSRPEPGGQLIVSNGVFKVAAGTSTLPIVIPPGLTLQGTNGKGSYGSSRIQLTATGATSNQNLFRIGNFTSFVTVRDLSLVYCPESGCVTGLKYRAIYAAGDGESSLHFSAVNLSIQGFGEGISVEGLDSAKDWQFGSAKIDNSTIADCLFPIRLNAQNAEFQITNTFLSTVRLTSGDYNNLETALLIERAGPIGLYHVYGGIASRDVTNKPLAFIRVVGRHSSIKLVNCESENTEHSFLYDYNPPANDIKPQLTFDGNGFGDLVVFKGNVILTSVGNQYGANSVQFWGTDKGGNSTASEVYSYGDTFAAVTNKLEVCPEASGVTAIAYPAERPNGDFHRLTDTDITPVTGNLEKNVCRRDFYLFNAVGETNRVVARTAQRAYSTGDSDSLKQTHFQAPILITAPPTFDPYLTDRPGKDRFKAWGYKIERNSTDGGLDFLGNQKPPNFEWNASFFKFNGGVYPTDDNAYELGNAGKRWALVRGVTVTSGDTILTDKETGKELYKIHEDEDFIFFSDIRTGKTMMKLGRDGNLYVVGRVIENSQEGSKSAAQQKKKSTVKRSKKTRIKK